MSEWDPTQPAAPPDQPDQPYQDAAITTTIPRIDDSAPRPSPQPGPAAGTPPADDPLAPVPDAAVPPAETEFVTCPECGNSATVTLNRRQSEDFCRNCDFPLFWTPSLIVLDTGNLGADSLRRLPGTTGRAMAASVPCPHCAERNTLSAEVCIRCGRSMHVQAPPPLPEPVYAPPPPPEPVEEPPAPTPWWLWFIVAAAVVGIVIGILYGTGTIG